MPTEAELQEKVAELATRLDVPGVAVGVAMGQEMHVAFHGVTNLDEPLPVDAGTLFQIGSTGKTYTATAIMRARTRSICSCTRCRHCWSGRSR